jgi:hypothetical protein
MGPRVCRGRIDGRDHRERVFGRPRRFSSPQREGRMSRSPPCAGSLGRGVTAPTTAGCSGTDMSSSARNGPSREARRSVRQGGSRSSDSATEHPCRNSPLKDDGSRMMTPLSAASIFGLMQRERRSEVGWRWRSAPGAASALSWRKAAYSAQSSARVVHARQSRGRPRDGAVDREAPPLAPHEPALPPSRLVPSSPRRRSAAGHWPSWRR